MHGGQDIFQHALEECGREGAEPLRQGLLGHLDRAAPEEAFLLQQADQLGGAADLAPDHGEDEGDHHREGEHPLAQAEAMEVGHLRQGLGMDDLGQFLAHLGGEGHTVEPLGAVILDRPRVADRRVFLRLGGL